MRKHSVVWLAMAALAFVAVPAIAQDNLDGDWPSAFGGLYGTARAPSYPVIFPPGGEVEIAWMLDPNEPNGIHFTIPPNASQIVFDSAGNLYWHSQGRWQNGYVASCTPDGEMRWVGPPQSLGQYSTDNTPVVGQAAVYMVGMFDPNEFDPNMGYPHCELTAQQVFALNKIDGSQIWRTMLDNESYCPEAYSCNSQPNPILCDGRLFVMGIPDPTNGSAVYQINAATGLIHGNNRIASINNKMCGNSCLLPNRFGPGVHAMYVLMFDDFNAVNPQIFALRVDTTTNTTSKKWESDPNYGGGYEIGFLDWGTWAHIMYNPTTDRIYVYTEDNSWGYELFSFDPNDGDDLKGWGDSGAWPLTSAQFQTGALDFDDTRILTGALDGGFTMYADDGAGNVSFIEALQHLTWGHPRQFVQLLWDTETESTVAVTGTGGIDSGMTHIMMCDLDDRTDPTEDGPMYIDEIEVYEGADIDHLVLVWSDDFESYSAGSPPGGSWTVSYGGDQPAPIVVDDPTGGGQGKVLAFDPVPPSDPNDPNAWWGHGAHCPFTQTTEALVVTRYRQWMQDSSELYEVTWGQDLGDHTRGYAYGSEWNNRRCTIEWLGEWDPWDRPNFQIEQRWEDVMYTYDFPATDAKVKMADRNEVVNDWSGESFAPTAKAAGFGIMAWQGSASDNWSRLRVNYLHDIRDTWQDVNAHGGPIVGPDGKIYYFEGKTGDGSPYYPPANANPGCLFALQPKVLCVGDVDGDDDTDLADLAALLGAYNSTPGDPNWNPNCDFDGDDDVDLSDLAHLLGDYNCGK